MNLLDDVGRAWKIAAAVAVLALLGGYYAWIATHLQVGYRECVAAPAVHDGRTLVFPLWVVTRVDGPDRYAISKVARDVPVAGDTASLSVGDTVSVMGVFEADSLLVHETVREIHHLRPWKEGLGVLGFVVAAALAPVFFRVDGRRVVERRG